MPCNYKKDYSENWLTEIRPAILKRANNCCEICGVKNGKGIFRGTWDGVKIFQDGNGDIFHEDTGLLLGSNVYAVIEPSTGNPDQKAIKVVLTVAHLDHNTSNNDYANLKALCQLHHLRHDVGHHKQSRKKKRGLQELNFE